jgi:signal transduction histidine kinase
MRPVRLALWPVGIAFGIAAELPLGEDGALAALDLVAGIALIGCGLTAWERRPGGSSITGLLLAGSGVAWFLANFASWAVYLHRGPLIHLLLVYPGARLRSRLEWTLAGAGYVYAASYPVARNDAITIGMAIALAWAVQRRFSASSGPERTGRAAALAATMVFAGVLVTAAVARIADLGGDRLLLAMYDLVIALVAASLLGNLFWGRLGRATLTGLVVDLGEPGDAGTLRDRLASALGDPSLRLGYWLPDQACYVDETGRAVHLPSAGSGRAVTPIDQDGVRVAALVHDSAALADPALVADVAAATRLAVANVQLQAEVRAHVAEVDASRRRIVEAGDRQRRRLERELREGAGFRLTRVAELLGSSDPELEDAAAALAIARRELTELARGIHPATLVERGLHGALHELAGRALVPVEIAVSAERFPPAVEVAAYFVCSEGLANVAKYARASSAAIQVAATDGALVIVVADDGAGGADPSSGSGLRGLADRMAALGGRFEVTSPRGRGTRLRAELPLEPSP